MAGLHSFFWLGNGIIQIAFNDNKIFLFQNLLRRTA